MVVSPINIQRMQQVYQRLSNEQVIHRYAISDR